VIYLREGDTLVQMAAYGLKNPVGREIFQPITIPVGDGIVGRVAETGVSEMVTDIRKEPSYIPDQFPGLSELAVPITFENRVIGVIDSEASEVNAYDEGDLAALQWLATIAAPRIVYALEEKTRRATQELLREANEHLERRVADRTEELSRAVIRLRTEIEERVRVERALEIETQRQRATLQSMSEAVIATDAWGRIVLFNAAAEAFSGWSSEAALGQSVDTVIQTAPAETRGVGESGPELSLEELLREEGQSGRRVDRRMRTRDGGELQVHETSSLVRDADGVLLGLVVVIRDVTEQQRYERELLRGQRLESLGVLAGGIAHDFNNLLTSVRGNIDLVAASGTDDELRQRALSAAQKACGAAAALPNQLLALSEGGAPIKGVAAPIEELVRHTVELVVDPRAGECVLEFPSDPYWVEIDEDQIGRVLQNLLVNAQHAVAGGGRIEVRVRNVDSDEEESSRWVEVEVEDDGVGIAPDVVERVFDPYFTTKTDGSGLGLTTSYWIAKRHGGGLTVSTEVGVGTRFVLRLPASEAAEPVADEPDPVLARDVVRVLVLDDEPTIRLLMDRALSSFGHRVETAATGEELLEVFSREQTAGDPFDLIIVDLTIPNGMGGAETVQTLREAGVRVPAVVMSGYSRDPVLASHEAYGFQAKLVKPFGVDDLREAVGLALSVAAESLSTRGLS
jgi:PAS domain S-box-containing protein